MKVAEALALRADLQRRLEQLKQRLVKNARVQEGDQPAEAPDELQAEFETCARELISLIQRINRTNSSSRLDSGTLADALAERDVLKLRVAAYRELAAAASTTQARTTRSEVKFVSTVSVAATQRKADDLAKELRQLDTRIQEADWKTDLLD
jgi:methyl-accepting chemotaxis protein